MNKKRVVIGLSGGVDSSVAAALLLEQGREVEAVYLECYNEPGCRTDQDKADALKVAIKLGIPFKVLDFRKEYKEKVVEYFYSEYKAGRTPNPDVVCNREIKFGIFYEYALANGYDFVATGHYARMTNRESPEWQKMSGNLPGDSRQGQWIQRALDKSKDQSYFLWQIPRDHLSHILFPLGNMLKSEVRAKAQELGLPTASKPDSMGICFIGDVDVSKLLRDRLGENPGDVVMNDDGNFVKVGTHKGLWFYTKGERGGFALDKIALKKLGLHPEKMGPMYVVGKNIKENQLIIGSREETMTNEFKITKCSVPGGDGKLYVRIRNLGELVEIVPFDGENIVTKDPIFGVAEGQSAVLYREYCEEGDEILVTGGTIV